MGRSKLVRRFRDIAQKKAPFEECFQILELDREVERARPGNLGLQVGHDAIAPETVANASHQVCIRNKWGASFKKYQDTLKERAEAEREATRVLISASEDDRYNRIPYNRADYTGSIVVRCGDCYYGYSYSQTYLAQALEKRPGMRNLARRDPGFEQLREDPRFWEVVELSTD
jgi:hypothetical protein